jgi:hypothetical protein
VGYLPDYEDDIFISYAHNDNQALPGRSARLGRCLSSSAGAPAASAPGRKPSIGAIPRLQGNEYFADALVEQVPKVPF